MNRLNIRQPSPGRKDPFEEGFRSPTANDGRAMFSSTPRTFHGTPPQYFGCGQNSSPNAQFNNRSYTQAGGRPRNYSSYNPRGQNAIPHGVPFGLNVRRQGYHVSHRTTPFGSSRDTNGVEKYYSPSMMQDPWAGLQPAGVPDVISKGCLKD